MNNVSNIWEETASIEPEKNCLSNNVSEPSGITNDINPVSTENPCKNIGKIKKWTKNCPKCGKEQHYSHREGLWNAKKKNAPCLKCGHASKEYKQKLSKAQIGVPNTAVRKRPFESTYNELRRTSNKRGITCDLSYEEFLSFTTYSTCHYCNSPIEWQAHQGTRNKRKIGSNLDRKNNYIGYTLENCCVCCKVCNSVKNTFFSYQEMLLLGKSIQQINKDRHEQTN